MEEEGEMLVVEGLKGEWGASSQSLVMLMIFQYRRASDRSHRCGRRCDACGFVATCFLPLLLSIEKP